MELRRTYEKDFRNLHFHEARLSRRREKEMTELCNLQTERKEQETESLKGAARQYIKAIDHNRPFAFDSLGFEFSKERFIAFLAYACPDIQYKNLPAQPAEPMQATA